MFGIGMPEMILILAVALIVIGPRKLPELAKSLGRAMGEFKKATRDLKESFEVESELQEVKQTFTEIEKAPAPDSSESPRPADEPGAETGDSQPQTVSEPKKMTYEDVQAEINKRNNEHVE